VMGEHTDRVLAHHDGWGSVLTHRMTSPTTSVFPHTRNHTSDYDCPTSRWPSQLLVSHTVWPVGILNPGYRHCMTTCRTEKGNRFLDLLRSPTKGKKNGPKKKH
jgi:hypothetical protein